MININNDGYSQFCRLHIFFRFIVFLALATSLPIQINAQSQFNLPEKLLDIKRQLSGLIETSDGLVSTLIVESAYEISGITNKKLHDTFDTNNNYLNEIKPFISKLTKTQLKKIPELSLLRMYQTLFDLVINHDSEDLGQRINENLDKINEHFRSSILNVNDSLYNENLSKVIKPAAVLFLKISIIAKLLTQSCHDVSEGVIDSIEQKLVEFESSIIQRKRELHENKDVISAAEVLLLSHYAVLALRQKEDKDVKETSVNNFISLIYDIGFDNSLVFPNRDAIEELNFMNISSIKRVQLFEEIKQGLQGTQRVHLPEYRILQWVQLPELFVHCKEQITGDRRVDEEHTTTTPPYKGRPSTNKKRK